MKQIKEQFIDSLYKNVWRRYYNGGLSNDEVVITDYGIRPVITIPID